MTPFSCDASGDHSETAPGREKGKHAPLQRQVRANLSEDTPGVSAANVTHKVWTVGPLLAQPPQQQRDLTMAVHGSPNKAPRPTKQPSSPCGWSARGALSPGSCAGAQALTRGRGCSWSRVGRPRWLGEQRGPRMAERVAKTKRTTEQRPATKRRQAAMRHSDPRSAQKGGRVKAHQWLIRHLRCSRRAMAQPFLTGPNCAASWVAEIGGLRGRFSNTHTAGRRVWMVVRTAQKGAAAGSGNHFARCRNDENLRLGRTAALASKSGPGVCSRHGPHNRESSLPP